MEDAKYNEDFSRAAVGMPCDKVTEKTPASSYDRRANKGRER